ncbi:hypothetical protein ADK52_00070 [Streptomyces sp. WM6372]|nr:hypothetical protein ADK52_00070 [Streptomyces sp. WM6372]
MGAQHLRNQGPGGLAGVESARANDQGGQVGLHSAPLEHAVGKHDKPVTRLQVQPLHPIGGTKVDTER